MTTQGPQDRIPELALDWHRGGKGAVLVTVARTWGSAPRRAGAQMVVRGDGAFEGSVSGGCVEGAVVIEALEALRDGTSRLVRYGVSDGDAFSAGLACGGEIRVLVEPVGGDLPEPMLARLVALREARSPVAYTVDTRSWARGLDLTDRHADRMRADRSGFEPDGVTFVAVHNPPLRLVVVGAVHIAQMLLPMARMANYDAVLIDPREAFATGRRFPGAVIHTDYPDEVLDQVKLDARTALVTLAHDPKIDDPALVAGLESGVFYIGALGSSRTHAARLERLAAAGIAPEALARIHGPVGLDIGAQGPAEIAVSILAQMTQALRRRE